MGSISSGLTRNVSRSSHGSGFNQLPSKIGAVTLSYGLCASPRLSRLPSKNFVFVQTSGFRQVWGSLPSRVGNHDLDAGVSPFLWGSTLSKRQELRPALGLRLQCRRQFELEQFITRAVYSSKQHGGGLITICVMVWGFWAELLGWSVPGM